MKFQSISECKDNLYELILQTQLGFSSLQMNDYHCIAKG